MGRPGPYGERVGRVMIDGVELTRIHEKEGIRAAIAPTYLRATWNHLQATLIPFVLFLHIIHVHVGLVMTSMNLRLLIFKLSTNVTDCRRHELRTR